jgi:multiple sugar transport system substrate-binding protein
MAPPFAGTDIIMFDKSDEEDLATWKFMKYLLNPEIQAYWSIKSGYMPAVSTALDTPQYKEYIEQNPDVVVPLEELPYGSIDPNIAEWNEIRTILGTMVGDVINGKKSVDEGLAWAEKEIEREFNK